MSLGKHLAATEEALMCRTLRDQGRGEESVEQPEEREQSSDKEQQNRELLEEFERKLQEREDVEGPASPGARLTFAGTAGGGGRS
jgi:hypothetical protein